MDESEHASFFFLLLYLLSCSRLKKKKKNEKWNRCNGFSVKRRHKTKTKERGSGTFYENHKAKVREVVKSTTAQQQKKKRREEERRKEKQNTHSFFFFLLLSLLLFLFSYFNKGRGDILNRRNKQIEEGRLQPCHPLLRIHTHTQKDTVNAWVAIHFKSSAFFLFLFFFGVLMLMLTNTIIVISPPAWNNNRNSKDHFSCSFEPFFFRWSLFVFSLPPFFFYSPLTE